MVFVDVLENRPFPGSVLVGPVYAGLQEIFFELSTTPLYSSNAGSSVATVDGKSD